MEDRPLVLIADPHLGLKDAADESCPEGVLWAVETGLAYRPAAVVALGDWVEAMEQDPDDVVEAQQPLLWEVDRRLGEARVPFWYVKGNHEPPDFPALLTRLRTTMIRTTVVGFEGPSEWEGWVLLHGHEIDPWCHGPQSVLSEIGGAIGGILERLIPGFQIDWLNPTEWTNPPRCESNAFQMLIREAADAYAAKLQKRVAHGHTHRRRITADRQVVCAGTCTRGRGEFAAIWPDGNVVLHEMRPLEV